MNETAHPLAATPPLARRLIGGAALLFLGAAGLLWASFGTEAFLALAMSGLALCF